MLGNKRNVHDMASLISMLRLSFRGFDNHIFTTVSKP